MIEDREFAVELVRRLNVLIESGDAHDVMGRLVEARLTSARWRTLADHPSVQVMTEGDRVTVGILGMLNGAIGAIPDGPRAGFGYLAAEFSEWEFVRFRVVD